MARIRYKYNGQYLALDGLNGVGSSNIRPVRNGFFFGDSFVRGRNGDRADGTDSISTLTDYPLHQTINNMLGISLVNKGVGGMGWEYTNYVSQERAFTVISATDFSSADIVILAFGVNDSQTPIGTKPYAEGTIMKQVEDCVSYIYQQKPDCRVILVAPWVQGILDYDGTNNGAVEHTRRALSAAMQEFCIFNHVAFISMDNNPFNKFNLSINDGHGIIGADNRHPTERGYILLGQWLAGEIARIIG